MAGYVPSGPVTVTVLLGICLYEVKSLCMYGSPMVSSTPGGIDMGVRPSLDGLDADAENCRRAAGAGAALWKAGTRKEGSDITDEGEIALALLGASIVVFGWRRPAGCSAQTTVADPSQAVADPRA